MGAEPVIPVWLLLAVNETVPLKPLIPPTLIVVEWSLFPRETVTVDGLRETLKSAGVIVKGTLMVWVKMPQLQNPAPVPVIPTEYDPADPLQVRVSEPVVAEVKSTEPLAKVHVRSEERRVGKECRSRW